MTPTRTRPEARRPRIGPDIELTYASPLLAQTHETLSGLHSIGLVDEETMRAADEGSLVPPTPASPDDIRAFRAEEGISQRLLACYLAVSENEVVAWESGERTPSGPALKLLALAREHGTHYIA